MTAHRLGSSAFVVTLLMTLSVESHAQDPCAPWRGGPTVGIADDIKVVGASGNMQPDMTALNQGMLEWNWCQGVPNFSTSNGVSPVTVFFWNGRNDGTFVQNCGLECGCWAPDGTRSVHIFTQNHDGSRNCMLTWKNVIAHELGHVLGLANAEPWCGDCRIMGNTACGPGVTGAECNIIDPRWFVEDEDEEDCNNPQLEGGDHNFDPCPGQTCPPTCTPILLDLAGDGFRFTGAREGVDFDMMGGNQFVRIAWSEPRNDDVLLVLDRNNSGWIEDGGELFGNFTAQPPALEPNGYRALEVFDTAEFFGNGDGRIDRSDRIYGALLVWRDGNQNGVSEVSELYTLEEAGVDAIYLDYWESDEVDKYGNELRYFGRVCLSATLDTAADSGTTRMLLEDKPNARSVLDPMGLRDGTIPVAVLVTNCEGRIVQSTDVFFVSEGESQQR